MGHIGHGKLYTKQRRLSITDNRETNRRSLASMVNAAPFPVSTNRRDKALQLVHSDVHGPLPVRTHSGYRYWITFIDDSSRLRAVILLKAKSDAFAAFTQFKAHAEAQTSQRLPALRDNKGGEYISNKFDAFCAEHGIERQHTVHNRP